MVSREVENLKKDIPGLPGFAGSSKSNSKRSSAVGGWFVVVIDTISSSKTPSQMEADLMKLVLDEMSQFYDVVNDREFDQIKEKYSSSITVLHKVVDKVSEFDW